MTAENTEQEFNPMENWSGSTPDFVQVQVTKYTLDDGTVTWCPGVSFMYEKDDEGCQFCHTIESNVLYYSNLESAVHAGFTACCFFTDCIVDDVVVIDADTDDVEVKDVSEFAEAEAPQHVHISSKVV